MDKRIEKLLVKLANLASYEENDESWDDPEDMLNDIPPLMFEARKILKANKVKWKEED